MDTGVIVALVAGGATTVTAGVGWLAQRGQTKVARDQLGAQKADAERDDAHRLVELANELGGKWIDRLAGEVDRLRNELRAAESRISELTADVKRLNELERDRDQLRAQLAAVTAERDQLLTDIAALSAGSEARP